jgi:ABC-type amino acid transport substrate-binding protein
MKLTQGTVIVFLAAAAAFTITGCGKEASTDANAAASDAVSEESSTEESSTEGSSAEESSDEVKEIVIGIGSTYNPFCYLDEDGNQQGWDYEVLKRVDELLPQYSFTYEATEFSNILVGLDADKYDIAVHHYGYNEERNKNYLYAKVANWPGTGYVIAAIPGQDYKTEADLQGHTSRVSSTSNVSFLLETYNESLGEGEEPIELVYDDADGEVLWNNIYTGVYDSYIVDEFTFDTYNAAYGGILEKYGKDLLQDIEGYGTRTGTYFIYNYGDEELQTAIDEALDQLIQDGTLAELSTEVFGTDYITDNIDRLYAE